MPERIVSCHACAHSHAFEDVVPRTATCDGCGADLRCCLTCRFYDETAYNRCSEPSAERVVEKDKANFCDYHSPRASGVAGSTSSADAGGDAKAALDKLFKT